MVDRAYKTGDASVDMKNGAKDMGHDVKNNMKDAYHEAKAGMNERKAEDAAAKREHEEAQRTGDPAAAMRAQQHEQRKDEKGEGFMESVKESIGKAGEAIKDAAVDAKDNVKHLLRPPRADAARGSRLLRPCICWACSSGRSIPASSRLPARSSRAIWASASRWACGSSPSIRLPTRPPFR